MLKELNQVIRAWKRVKNQAQEGSDEALILQCVESNVTYRLLASSSADRLIGLRVLLRTIRSIAKSRPSNRCFDEKGKLAVLEGLFQYEELEREYVEKQTGKPVGYFFSKQDLMCASTSASWKILGSLRLVLFALPIVFRCISSANRANLALLITEVAEIAGLVHLCRKFDIEAVYDFIPFEVDGNFISYVLRDEPTLIVKLPSPGPLKTHNHVLLGDRLVLSSQYQFDEMQTLPGIRIENIDKWVPEYAFTYIDRYKARNLGTTPMTIGFYSHGGWQRIDEGHSDDGLNIPEAEEKLLADLARFMQDHPEFKLKIFPHPREKSDEWIERSKAFYAGYFGESVELAGKETRTAFAFEEIDIALAAFSTIVYERMFCGYKTLIGNYGFETFPMEGSSLRNIAFHEYSSLERLVLQASATTSDEFFSRHELTGYRFFEYPYFTEA